MESLGDILRRVTARNISRTTNGEGVKFQINQPAVDLCLHCKDSGWITKRVPVGHPDFGEAFPCDCQETTDPAARAASLRRYSNLGPLSRVTFASTQHEGLLPDAGSRDLFSQALEAAVRFAEEPHGWLTFAGPSGSGKTHLAVAIAGVQLGRGLSLLFKPVPELLDRLRSTYSPQNPVSYDQLFEEVRTASLLVLDDLGAQSSTPWAEEKLYQIIVHRQEARLPTIITLRDFMEDHLPAPVQSRLKDISIVSWFPIIAPDFRDKGASVKSAKGTKPNYYKSRR